LCTAASNALPEHALSLEKRQERPAPESPEHFHGSGKAEGDQLFFAAFVRTELTGTDPRGLARDVERPELIAPVTVHAHGKFVRSVPAEFVSDAADARARHEQCFLFSVDPSAAFWFPAN